MRANNAAYAAAIKAYHETHVVCTERCAAGWIATGLVDADQVPISRKCGACNGVGFVHIQPDLFPESQ